ncbi:MAG: M1 family aminopeptidase [Saprospiraceae bacterium]|nr:M1 family aminopeptidase [Saprospiraceae bacterium]
MKCLFLFLFILSISGGTVAQEPLLCKDVRQLVELEKQQHKRVISFTASSFTQNYDLKYHRLEWEVDPAVHYISGKITSHFIPTQEDFNQVNFDFKENMVVNAVSYHGAPVSFTLTSDDRLQIDLHDTIAVGVLDSISVKYEGTPHTQDFGSFVTSMHNDVPVLWTLSEPFGAKNWWPCKQDLTDKIDSVDIKVTTPKEYRVGSNGLLVGKVEGTDGYITYHWRHRYPIPAYLISIAVTNYIEFTDYVYLDNGDSIPILNYVYPEAFATAQSQLKSTVEQMELFNELVGLYPFAEEKYGHAQFGFFGGMEHQTMSSMGVFFPRLQAHELAHQWFGDKVTCASWEDIWLNEGFATYLEALTLEFLSADQEPWRNWKEFSMLFVTNQPGGSTWVDDTTNVARIFDSRLSYQKGAFILHMLRWRLGDDLFFQGLRNYLEDPLLAYGYVTTTDLKRHLETVSGSDLTEFFTDWYYGQGYPRYSIRFTSQTDAIAITIDQETSHPSVDFFEMPVPVRVYNDVRDTMLTLDHTFSGQTFEVDLPFTPVAVEFDPAKWILSRDNLVKEIITDTRDLGIISSAVNLMSNPTEETFEISIENDRAVNAILSISIVDSEGKKLLRTEQIRPRMIFDISTWSAGQYFITFTSLQGHFTKAVIKA